MEQQRAYELPLISAVSPSLAETLRNCPLQAGISRIRAMRAYVLGNPKAWLGTAYHVVLEHLWTPGKFNSEGRFDELWRNAIAALHAQAIAHPMNKRFADPERWPGYHLVHAFALLRATEALSCQTPEPMSTRSPGRVIREKDLFAMGGKLIGKPDVIIGSEIRDYKSGRIYEEDLDGKRSVKEAYIRQLRLYGRLVEESFGECPTKGVLLPMQGAAVEVSLDQRVCALEAEQAVKLLDAYNSQLQVAPTVSNVATPSPKACRWCQYKALCPAFWDNVNESWTNGLGGACVRGTLECAPEPIHNGQAFALTVMCATGSISGSPTIAPLERTVHSHVAPWQGGEVVRVINLHRRHDGQLATTAATVCLLEQDSPIFTLPATTERA